MSIGFTPASYLEKAERALEGARVLLAADDTEGACSRAYYGMHDAAHAALFALGHEAPTAPIKHHHTLIGEFGKRLVLTGQLDASLGRSFNKVQDMRLLADYSSEPPAIEDAKQAVAQAEIFVAAIRNMLASLAKP